MKRLVIYVLLLFGFSALELLAQNLTAAALASPAKPQKKPADKDPLKTAMGLPPGQAITTEIYADEAFFDSANHIGIFTGHVIVNDPRASASRARSSCFSLGGTTFDGMRVSSSGDP